MKKNLVKFIISKSKLIFTSVLFCFVNTVFFAQTPDQSETVRIHIWSELDAYPELKEAQDTNSGIFDYSVERIKTISPYLVNGMVYGWNFVYVPSDKLRNVEEYFEITPIAEIKDDRNIQYEKPWVQDNLVHVWAKYEKTPEEIWSYRTWNSISTKKASGSGSGAVSKGFEGITEAAKNAVKDGIRSFYRPIVKNKPKEIDGKIIISKEPVIGIKEGQYVIKLDFLLESDRIIKYTQF